MRRSPLLAPVCLAALLAAVLFLSLYVGPPSLADGARSAQQTVPPPTATFAPPPEPLASVHVTPSVTNVTVGGVIAVTVTTNVGSRCAFPIYDVTLEQSEPLFVHTDPPSSVIGPPGPNTAVYRLTAVRPGQVVFAAKVYGERQCGGVLAWEYVQGSAEPVSVSYGWRTLALPFVRRGQ